MASPQSSSRAALLLMIITDGDQKPSRPMISPQRIKL
jgi:hypothetical protein